jgi:hypothetical protein
MFIYLVDIFVAPLWTQTSSSIDIFAPHLVWTHFPHAVFTCPRQQTQQRAGRIEGVPPPPPFASQDSANNPMAGCSTSWSSV